MSNFKQQRWIPELWLSLHRQDKNPDARFAYEKNFLRRSTSVVMWRNTKLASFMAGLNWLFLHLIY